MALNLFNILRTRRENNEKIEEIYHAYSLPYADKEIERILIKEAKAVLGFKERQEKKNDTSEQNS